MHRHVLSALSPRSFHEGEEIFTRAQNSDTKIKMRPFCLFHRALNPTLLADNHMQVHVTIPELTPKA